MVCFRYVIVNTLHKGDNQGNNNNKSPEERIFFYQRTHIRRNAILSWKEISTMLSTTMFLISEEPKQWSHANKGITM